MARPRKPGGPMLTLTVKLDPALAGRLEEVRQELQEVAPGLEVTRSDAVRVLLLLGLEARDRKRKRRR